MVSINDYTNLQLIFVLFCISSFATNILWYCMDYSQSKFIPSMRANIIRNYVAELYKYHYSYFQNNQSGTIAAQIDKLSDCIPHIIQTIAMEFFQITIMISVSVILLSKIHIGFGLGILTWLALYAAILYLSYEKMAKSFAYSAEVRYRMSGHVVDYITQILNVKIFACLEYEKRRLSDIGNDYIVADVETWKKSNNYFMTQGVICSIYFILCTFFMLHLSKLGRIMPGDFALVFMLNTAIADWIFQLTHILRNFINNWNSVAQALSLFANPSEILDKPNATALHCTHGQITFDNVKFHYKGTEPLFQNKSIEIKAGQKVGLVGYSGGGKSTFVNLILRLYDVTDGAILIDGQDIRDVTQDSLRENIAMIPQDPSLFHRSLMENIRYGRADSTDEEVIEAAKKAHAHEFISTLPQGYDSLVGERGVKLSGGQRQRIAIARAILKNAPILILDEATSQLDSVTESLIQESLWELMQNKTTIVIAHRLSTLLHMDRILVFDKGKIVEDGTHSELLAKAGLYKSLWDAQVGGFLGDEKTEDVHD